MDGKKQGAAPGGKGASGPSAEAIASSPNGEIIGIFKELADHFFKTGEDSGSGVEVS